MEEIKNKYFEFETINLDDNSFESCRFSNCKLVFSGLGNISLSNCNFENVKWEFTGPASNTINFLSGMYHGMGELGKKIVEETFNGIRNKK